MARYEELVRNIESAPEGPQIGALFDVDGTLIAGYSAVEFLKERLRRRSMSPQEFLGITAALAQFGLGAMSFAELMSTSAGFMRGMREDEYAAFAEELYKTQIARRVYPESRALVRAHQARGHTVAIISSATPYQVEPLARDLGIGNVICSRFEVRDGEFTGEIAGPLCFGPGKVEAAEGLARELGLDLGQSYFYGDSADDIDLLMCVGHPQPLNPDSKLTRFAESRQWPIRRFDSRGRAGLTGYLRSAAATVSMIPAGLAGLPIWALTGSRREGLNFATSLFGDVSSALVGLKLVVRGEEHLWSHRPAVFVFNHQSKADVIIIARLLRRDIASVAKQEIKKNPLIGKTMELAGTIFIDRSNAKAAIRSMRQLVTVMREQGKCVVMAPEGTRTVSPRLAPFKKGAFHLALQAGVPMVPIVIHNSGDVAPKGEFVMRPATVEVDVLPPIDTSGWSARTVEQHVLEVRRLFQRTLGQDEDDGPAPEPVDSRAPARAQAVDREEQTPSAEATAAVQKKTAPRKKAPRKKAARKKVASKKVAVKKVLKKKVLKKKARRKKKTARPASPPGGPTPRGARKAPRRKPLRKKALPGKARTEGPGG